MVGVSGNRSPALQKSDKKKGSNITKFPTKGNGWILELKQCLDKKKVWSGKPVVSERISVFIFLVLIYLECTINRSFSQTDLLSAGSG